MLSKWISERAASNECGVFAGYEKYELWARVDGGMFMAKRSLCFRCALSILYLFTFFTFIKFYVYLLALSP